MNGMGGEGKKAEIGVIVEMGQRQVSNLVW